MKSGTARARARCFVQHLLRGNENWLSSRKADDCWEMGDGDEVYKHVMAILAENKITRFEQLNYVAKRFAAREWFDPEFQAKQGVKV